MAPLQGICRAHTNIALIKYWGKRDQDLILPMNSNLSLTLDRFYTDTEVHFSSDFTSDRLILNDTLQEEAETQRISQFLDHFRAYAGTSLKAQVTSYNHVPTAAGLASSASAFAALAGACNQALALELDLTTLSRFARLGSGSATRSIFGGFVEWQKGTGDKDSIALPFDDAQWDIGMIIIALNKKQKVISSREGMAHAMATSPFYSLWPTLSKEKLAAIKPAIKAHDLQKIGEIAEHHAMMMHATTLSANPPFSYFEPETLVAIQAVHQIRQSGIPAYVTMDAGPNVKVLCHYSDADRIMAKLQDNFPSDQLIASKPGQGIQLLDHLEALHA